MRPHAIGPHVSQLVLVGPSPFPRRFSWKKDQSTPSTLRKPFITLLSSFIGGKESITRFKERHTFDLSDPKRNISSFFTVVPFSDEREHEIDLISKGFKLMLVYDIGSLNCTTCYNVPIGSEHLDRVRQVLEM